MTESEKKKNKFELPEDRLATTDEYGRRVKLYPAPVHGIFHNWRTLTQIFLIGLFFILPWVKINGHQALLLDLAHRKFNFFGLILWAHDAPLIFFVLAILTLSLAFITAIWGRVWCGWGCPQTVFLDGIYRRIEELVEGTPFRRKKLDDGPWDKNKVIKKTIKWVLFTLITLHISHTFLAYFVGAENLVHMSLSSPTENWGSFLFVMILSAILLFDFGYFREQFCVIACPYGRFQSILMDENSLAIMYDKNRGEPRRGQVPDGQEQGDCVNCYRCVTVCPTGVDIRRGIQMECIACTACADVCDEVMERNKKPLGLIRYASEAEIQLKQKRKILRPRIFAYLAIILLAFSGLTYFLTERQPLHISLIRGKSEPYRSISEPPFEVINQFQLNLKNQREDEAEVLVEIDKRNAEGLVEIVVPVNPITLHSDELYRTPIFFKFQKKYLEKSEIGPQGRKRSLDVLFKMKDKKTQKETVLRRSVPILGPL